MKKGCNNITIMTAHGYVDTQREYLERGKSANNTLQKSLLLQAQLRISEGL